MSLFHKTQETPGALSFTGEEAVIAVLFLVVTADGVIAPEEEELVIAASNRMKLLRKLGIDGFNDAVQKVRDAIDGGGREEVFAAGIKSLPADLNETVYALAADVVFADATAKPEENECLRKVQEALGVPDELATKVVEVMRIKNRG
jgi:tellurite resistance protein